MRKMLAVIAALGLSASLSACETWDDDFDLASAPAAAERALG